MKVRSFSLLLAFIMVASLFVACADSGDQGDLPSVSDTTVAASPGETEATEETSATAVETTAPPEYVKPEEDHSGKTFVFASRQNTSPNWIASHYVEAQKGDMNGDPINDAMYFRIVDTEETLDITIECNIFNDSDAIMNMVLAGDDVADCIILGGLPFAKALQKGLFRDLNEISTLDFSHSWWDQNAAKSLSLGGKLYGAVGDVSPMGWLAANCIYVNRALLDSTGLEDPVGLVSSGKWTYDVMEQMGRHVARDVNGDGIMDERDVFGLDSEPIGYISVGSCGIKYTEKDANDMPVLAIDQERAIAAVEKLVPLYRDKDITLYSQDFAGGYKNVFRELIVQKFIEDEILFVNNWLCVALELRGMESDFRLMPPPKLDEQQSDYMVYNSPSWTTYSVVPMTVKDERTDFVGDVMEALGYFGHKHIYTALIDTTITYKSLKDEQNKEMMELIYDKRVFDLADIYDFGGISSMMNRFVSSNTTNFASVYKSQSKVINRMIKSVVESLE